MVETVARAQRPYAFDGNFWQVDGQAIFGQSEAISLAYREADAAVDALLKYFEEHPAIGPTGQAS